MCARCPKTFARAGQLFEHTKTHTGERPYPCTRCPKRFATARQLQEHTRTHTGEKPYPCAVCDKRFATSAQLQVHHKIHTGEKKFNCAMCSKKFVQSGQLRAHIKTHTGQKDFQCVTCEKKFYDRSGLSRHMVTHSGEKPFNCDICGKCYTRSGTLKEHMRTVHSADQNTRRIIKRLRSYKCTQCRKRFASKDRLEVHTRTHVDVNVNCTYDESQQPRLTQYTLPQQQEGVHLNQFNDQMLNLQQQYDGTQMLLMQGTQTQASLPHYSNPQVSNLHDMYSSHSAHHVNAHPVQGSHWYGCHGVDVEQNNLL